MTETIAQPAVPAVGAQAPDFSLKSDEGNPVSLHDLRGKTVVLVFYPAAFSGTCTKELCTFRDQLTSLNDANAEVLGISVDMVHSNREFKKAQGLTFSLLSDFDREATNGYGVAFVGFQGYQSPVSKRAVFIVDGSGKIAWEWVGQLGDEPDYDQVLEEVGRIQG